MTPKPSSEDEKMSNGKRPGELGAVHVTAVGIHVAAELADRRWRHRPIGGGNWRIVEVLVDAAGNVRIDVLVEGLECDIALVPEVLLDVEVDGLSLERPQEGIAAATTVNVIGRIEVKLIALLRSVSLGRIYSFDAAKRERPSHSPSGS